MYNITRDVSLYYIPIAKRNRKGKKRFSFYTFMKINGFPSLTAASLV